MLITRDKVLKTDRLLAAVWQEIINIFIYARGKLFITLNKWAAKFSVPVDISISSARQQTISRHSARAA